MAVTYLIRYDANDDGTFSGDLSPDVLAAEWRLGMERPFDSIAAVGTATITVRNLDQRYTPGAPNSTLDRGLSLRIQSNDGDIIRTHFVGMVAYVDVSPGEYGDRTAIITAVCPMASLDQLRIRLSTLLDIRADEVVAKVLRRIPFRARYLSGLFRAGLVGQAEVGQHTVLPPDDALVGWSLQPGRSTFALVGDNWDDGVRALDAVREVVDAERGRFFVNRTGNFVLFNRHETLYRLTSDASFTDNMSELRVRYGANVVSHVRVTLRPRRIGAADDVLWTLAQPQLVRGAASREFVVRYRDANGDQIGALMVRSPVPYADYSVNLSPDGYGAEVTDLVDFLLIGYDGAAATMRLVNRGIDTAYLMPGSVIRGQAVYTADPLTIEQRDANSQTRYGPQEYSLNLPGLTALDEGDNIARYEIARRNTARSVVREMTLSGRQHQPQILARSLFDRVTITEAQSAHTADYFIVGEQHQVSEGGTAHTVRWILEPANPARFWRVGYGQLDGDTRLTY